MELIVILATVAAALAVGFSYGYYIGQIK